MNDIVTALRQIGTPACLEEAERLRLSGGGGRSFDLHLRDFGLTAPHAQVLAGAIHGTATGPLLRSFSASYNPDLTDAGASALAEAFPSTMTELGMVGCALSDEGGRAILDWAQRATGPRMICIEQNRFSAGFRRDAAALRDRHAGLMVVI